MWGVFMWKVVSISLYYSFRLLFSFLHAQAVVSALSILLSPLQTPVTRINTSKVHLPSLSLAVGMLLSLYISVLFGSM